MLSREAFAEEFAKLRASLEKRRLRYLYLFYLNTALACILLVITLFFARNTLEWLAALLHRTSSVATLEVASFVFFGLFASCMLILTPLLRYRGGLKSEYSLQRIIMLKLSEWLGECTIASGATSFEHLARDSGMFLAGAGIAEQVGLKGSINGISYSLQELVVSALLNGRSECIFRGIYIVCNMPKRAQVQFGKRKRLLLHPEEAVSLEALVAAGWEDAQTIVVETFERLNLAAISTHPAQTQPVITVELLANLHAIANESAALPATEAKLDSRLMNGLQHSIISVKTWFSRKSERPALAAEIAYEAQFTAPPELNAAQADSSPFAHSCAVAVIGDTGLIALPCAASLFSPPSLFNSSFSPAAAVFLRDLVEWVGQVSLPGLTQQ